MAAKILICRVITDCEVVGHKTYLTIEEATDGILCTELFASTSQIHAKHLLNTMGQALLKGEIVTAKFYIVKSTAATTLNDAFKWK